MASPIPARALFYLAQVRIVEGNEMSDIQMPSTEAGQRSAKQPPGKVWAGRTGLLSWLLPLLAVAVLVAVGVWAGLSTPVQAQGATVDHDADDDGLIEVSSLAQLNAIRWDLDGNGAADASDGDVSYAAAFPNAVAGMGCPSAGCTGYELNADLDFDTNGSGNADSGDDYWNNELGWEPIGIHVYDDSSMRFRAIFEGNGHSISNLFINRGNANYVGLFGITLSSSQIRNTGLRSFNVIGGHYVGGLVGQGRGAITSSYASGSVARARSFAGGLIGFNYGPITASYASGSVRGTGDYVGGLIGRNDGGQIKDSYFSGSVSGTEDDVGGLVGANWSNATITTSYASGSVTGTGEHVGGLVGDNNGNITASYASSSVTGDNYVGGLVGDNSRAITANYSSGFVIGTEDYVGGMVGTSRIGNIKVSYWDTETSGQTISDAGLGKTTAELQSPTGYTGIFANWNVNIDGNAGGDNPWDFGSCIRYPAVNADFNLDGTA